MARFLPLVLFTLLMPGCLNECRTLGHHAEITLTGDDALDRFDKALEAEGWTVEKRDTILEAMRGEDRARASSSPGNATTLWIWGQGLSEENATKAAEPLAARLGTTNEIVADEHCGQV